MEYNHFNSYLDVLGTEVGREDSSVPRGELWLALRLCGNMRPQLGKIRPDFAFHYAEIGRDRELLELGPQHIVHGHTRLPVFPAILMNAKDFEWQSASLQTVHALIMQAQAVPLAMVHGEGRILFGVRVRFCGWFALTHSGNRAYYGMRTNGALTSLLPGKLEYQMATGRIDLIFTWGGKTTSCRRCLLNAAQPFELLCYR